MTPSSGQVRVSGNGITPIVKPSPATFAPGASSLSVAGVLYRGQIRVAAASGKVAAANFLPRESYIQGVVPREMPASWHAEALQAQATAARTYSMNGAGNCSWNGAAALCATTSDQVYGGRSGETAATNAAVAATAGEAVTSGGNPIVRAYFFSTSGGRTAAIHEEWGGAPVSYLMPVNDPYDSISAHHLWGPLDAEADCTGTAPDCVFTSAQVKTKLGLATAPTDLRVTTRNSSSRVDTLDGDRRRLVRVRRRPTLASSSVSARRGSTWARSRSSPPPGRSTAARR